MNKKTIIFWTLAFVVNVGIAYAQLDSIGSLDVNNLITIAYTILGPVGRLIVLVMELALAGGFIGVILYWLFLRKVFTYKYPVNMYEVVQGRILKSHTENGGWIINKMGAGQVFKLMPTIGQWTKPIMIKPRLDQFQTTLQGKAYINFVRLGKDAYVPFVYEWNLKDNAVVKLAQQLDLDSIKNMITANYIKFREEGFWAKYGNQVIIVVFALIIGFFLFIVAKELTRTAEILNAGNNAMAEAIKDLGRQIVN